VQRRVDPVIADRISIDTISMPADQPRDRAILPDW
jgi:hypothetical protein